VKKTITTFSLSFTISLRDPQKLPHDSPLDHVEGLDRLQFHPKKMFIAVIIDKKKIYSTVNIGTVNM